MIGLLIAATAAAHPLPVEAAERAFAAMAQTQGQWTAFRATMGPGAIMLAPGVTRAKAFLAGRKDPPAAVKWWPERTVTSCDDGLAVSTGPWRREGGAQTGRFFTVWQRQPDGAWKWIYDGGTEGAASSPAGDAAIALRASCGLSRKPEPVTGTEAGGVSRDGTLRWRLDRTPDGVGHRFRVDFAKGARWESFVDVVLS